MLSSCRHGLCSHPNVSRSVRIGNSALTEVDRVHILSVLDQLGEGRPV